FCGPSMVFTNVYNPRSYIPRKEEIRPTLVKEGATLGANATIVCGHTIGRFAFVAAGAVVLNDIPDYALAAGNPAVVKGWVCRCGIRLHFEDGTATCDACGQRYQEDQDTVSAISKLTRLSPQCLPLTVSRFRIPHPWPFQAVPTRCCDHSGH
ncbi:MAG: N-acetyltransferase, partial [Deltaproteobacteria bacterium]